jgi:hypothetical protein
MIDSGYFFVIVFLFIYIAALLGLELFSNYCFFDRQNELELDFSKV